MAASRDPGAPRALIWPAVVVALLFAVMIGAALLQGRPVFDPPDLAFESDREPNPLPSVTAPPPAFGLEPDTSSPRGLELPVDLLNAIALAVLAAGVAVILVLVARRLLRNRPHRARAAAVLDDIAAGATEQVDAPTVRRGIDGAIARFAETPRHADAIVSAWIGLEETAADAGRARGSRDARRVHDADPWRAARRGGRPHAPARHLRTGALRRSPSGRSRARGRARCARADPRGVDVTRRRALLVAAAAVATLVVLVLIGVEPVFALAWAVAVAALGVVLALADHARTPPPQRLDVVRHRAGGRSDVVRIAASLDAR